MKETGLDGAGNLHVFRGKTISVFDLSPERRYELIAEGAPTGSGVEVVASFPEHMILHLPGNDDSGDSIVVYDSSRLELVSGILLGGSVVCAGPCRDGVVVQMENGTVLVLELETGDKGETSLRIDRAFFLEGPRGMIAGAGNSFMMSGKDGRVMYGKFDPYLPLAYEIESRSVLTPSLPIDKD